MLKRPNSVNEVMCSDSYSSHFIRQQFISQNTKALYSEKRKIETLFYNLSNLSPDNIEDLEKRLIGLNFLIENINTIGYQTKEKINQILGDTKN